MKPLPFKIALLGDSMTDCWGEECPELREELALRFPDKTFEIANHGLGGTRAGYGLWRIGNDYDKNGSRRACLSFGDPDLVLVESFAFNNRADGAAWLLEYRTVLGAIVAALHHTTRARVAVEHDSARPGAFRRKRPRFLWHLVRAAPRNGA